jgi:chaperonin cofactor prefoldin
MAFTVEDFADLTRLLQARPEWRTEMRRLVLTDEILELPAIVRDLADAQRRTEARVEELAEAQRRTEERLTRLEDAVASLAEAQHRTEKRVEELAEAQRRTEERLTRLEGAVAGLAEAQGRTQEQLVTLTDALTLLGRRMGGAEDHIAELRGDMLEVRYHLRAANYFGLYLRKARVVAPSTLVDEIEGELTPEDARELASLDLLIRGQLRARPDRPEVCLALEVSCVVDLEDVTRAHRRAAILRKLGCVAIPSTAGHAMTTGAESEAQDAGVVIFQNGRVLFWDEAVERWVPPATG